MSEQYAGWSDLGSRLTDAFSRGVYRMSVERFQRWFHVFNTDISTLEREVAKDTAEAAQRTSYKIVKSDIRRLRPRWEPKRKAQTARANCLQVMFQATRNKSEQPQTKPRLERHQSENVSPIIQSHIGP
jgi:hypothetical protein